MQIDWHVPYSPETGSVDAHVHTRSLAQHSAPHLSAPHPCAHHKDISAPLMQQQQQQALIVSWVSALWLRTWLQLAAAEVTLEAFYVRHPLMCDPRCCFVYPLPPCSDIHVESGHHPVCGGAQAVRCVCGEQGSDGAGGCQQLCPPWQHKSCGSGQVQPDAAIRTCW